LKKYTVYDILECRKCKKRRKKKVKRKSGELFFWTALCPECAAKCREFARTLGLDLDKLNAYEKKRFMDAWVDGLYE
jgi:hypothetical protein